MEFIEAQMKEKEMLMLYWHTRIVSGEYKQRKIYHGTVTSNGPEFTDEEKLSDAVGIMQKYLADYSSLVTMFGERKSIL